MRGVVCPLSDHFGIIDETEPRIGNGLHTSPIAGDALARCKQSPFNGLREFDVTVFVHRERGFVFFEGQKTADELAAVFRFQRAYIAAFQFLPARKRAVITREHIFGWKSGSEGL